MTGTDIWAVVPVKEFDGAKQRLAGFLSPAQRRVLAATMVEEVLAAIAGVSGLAGVLVVTVDAEAAALGRRVGARIVSQGARGGHTGSVNAAIRLLVGEGRGGMITLPGDIPAVTSAEIEAVLAAQGAAPAFTIAAAHDDQGSNAVLCSPPDSVPLRFGDNSFFPHLDAARACGIAPSVLRLPGIGMDIDHPADLMAFARLPQAAGTRTLRYLESEGILLNG